MSSEESPLLKEIVQRLVAAAHPRRIILFGSQAKGTAGPDSDFDLLVIEDVVPSKHREMVRLRRSLKGIPSPIDVLVVSREEFMARKSLLNNICHWADTEGKVLYDAAG